ncbi:MAG: hypothetical protein ABI222_02520 [Opitutaceae bacterium]
MAAPVDQAVNPLNSIMSSWMAPGDLESLKIVGDETNAPSISGSGSQPGGPLLGIPAPIRGRVQDSREVVWAH